MWCFLWVQGRHATVDELAASAYLAVQMDQQFNGEPVQVRVNMGKEPRHFLAIFKGKLVIFEVGNGIMQHLLSHKNQGLKHNIWYAATTIPIEDKYYIYCRSDTQEKIDARCLFMGEGGLATELIAKIDNSCSKTAGNAVIRTGSLFAHNDNDEKFKDYGRLTFFFSPLIFLLSIFSKKHTELALWMLKDTRLPYASYCSL